MFSRRHYEQAHLASSFTPPPLNLSVYIHIYIYHFLCICLVVPFELLSGPWPIVYYCLTLQPQHLYVFVYSPLHLSLSPLRRERACIYSKTKETHKRRKALDIFVQAHRKLSENGQPRQRCPVTHHRHRRWKATDARQPQGHLMARGGVATGTGRRRHERRWHV